MSKHSDVPKSKGIVQQVEQAIKTGKVDIELASGQAARQAAIKAVIKAEQVDPKKLRIPVDF